MPTDPSSRETADAPVSVITPTFNRAHTLPAVFESLLRQRCVLEWIVVDDGSTDGTEALINDFAGRATFDVRYLPQENAGKHAAVNRGVAAARGPMVALLDSDDAVLPGALDRLVDYWNAIGDKAAFVGVTGLDVDETGQVLGTRFPADVVDATWQEMVYRCRSSGDKWGILRADILQAHPFRLGNGYVFEGEVWRQIGRRYRTRYVNVPVLSCRTTGADRLTKRPFKAIASGAVSQYTLSMNDDIEWLWHHPTAFVKAASLLIRGQLHLGVPLRRQPLELSNWRARVLWAMCLPLGCLLFFRDRRADTSTGAAS